MPVQKTDMPAEFLNFRNHTIQPHNRACEKAFTPARNMCCKNCYGRFGAKPGLRRRNWQQGWIRLIRAFPITSAGSVVLT